MKKKRIMTMVTAVALTGVVMVGATFAYLTSQTALANNTFTVGQVKATLTENTKDGETIRLWDDERDGKNMYPGQKVEKEPVVTILANSSNNYVFLKVEGADALEAAGFTVNEFNLNNKWVKTDATITKDGIYRYSEVVEKNSTTDQELEPIFTSVTYNEASEGGEEVVVVGGIKVAACAVQQEGMTEETALEQAEFKTE